MGSTNTAASQFGWLYPDLGIMMISARMLQMPIPTNYCWCPTLANITTGYDVGATNKNVIIRSLIGAFTGSTTAIPTNQPSASFQARSSEKIYSTHYFIRLKNAEYNFSNNPSFTSGSQGQFSHPSMYKDPKVYVTTVGMYNNKNELLAIAKLSKPLLKSFTREALIRVKLEF